MFSSPCRERERERKEERQEIICIFENSVFKYWSDRKGGEYFNI